MKKKLFMEIKRQTAIEKKDNTIIYFSEIAWNGAPPKKEIRKWLIKEDSTNVPLKGVVFSDESSLDKLTEVLVEDGYGSTKTITALLNNRSQEDDTTEESEDAEDEASISVEEILESIRKDDK